MSTVLRDRRTGQLWLFTKGADSHVLPLCPVTTTDPALMTATLKHINEFARDGLRTLAIARRPLSELEYERFKEDMTTAANSLAGDRQQRMDTVAAQLEQSECMRTKINRCYYVDSVFLCFTHEY